MGIETTTAEISQTTCPGHYILLNTSLTAGKLRNLLGYLGGAGCKDGVTRVAPLCILAKLPNVVTPALGDTAGKPTEYFLGYGQQGT